MLRFCRWDSADQQEGPRRALGRKCRKSAPRSAFGELVGSAGKKCRKTAENVLEMLKKGRAAFFSAVFRHFFRHSQPGPRKHFGEHFFGTFGPELLGALWLVSRISTLVTRPKYPPPPYREKGVAIPLSHCVSCGIADYRCYTPTSFLKNGLSQSTKTGLTRGASQNKLASEAYRAVGGVARNSIANRAIVILRTSRWILQKAHF